MGNLTFNFDQFFREINHNFVKNSLFDELTLDFNQFSVKLAQKCFHEKIDHLGKNLLSKMILARVVDHQGKNLLSKMILARVVNFSVKSPGQKRGFLPSNLLLKIVRICIHEDVNTFELNCIRIQFYYRLKKENCLFFHYAMCFWAL